MSLSLHQRRLFSFSHNESHRTCTPTLPSALVVCFASSLAPASLCSPARASVAGVPLSLCASPLALADGSFVRAAAVLLLLSFSLSVRGCLSVGLSPLSRRVCPALLFVASASPLASLLVWLPLLDQLESNTRRFTKLIQEVSDAAWRDTRQARGEGATRDRIAALFASAH